MDRSRAHALVQQYVEGWKQGDLAQIVGSLAPTCVIIESHGPTYRGIEKVRQWVTAWNDAGATVDRWDITAFYFDEDAATFEWQFACTVEGQHYVFEGASVVRFADGAISSIREYRMTDPAFEWEWMG